MAKFKGSVYESTRAFVEQEHGIAGVDRVLAALPSADRDVLRSATAVAWLPVEPVLHFHHALDEIFGTGDLQQCVVAGEFSAGWSINTVLKLFVRLSSPSWLIEKGTSVWTRYHDTGRWELDPATLGRLSGRLKDFEVRDAAFCARLKGWLRGAAKLTGGHGAQVSETQCVCRGHDQCSFLVTWET